MTVHLFRNRWFRLYFELLDSFRESRCCLCFLLAQTEQEWLTALLQPRGRKKRSPPPLKLLCAFHKQTVKRAAADAPEFLALVKILVRDSLRDVAHSPVAWRRWTNPFRRSCPICAKLVVDERILLRTLVRYLGDTEFWKGFQRAPILCLQHLARCMELERKGKGLERLLEDQSAKLNDLLNDVIRFETTGSQGECVPVALNWLVDFVGPMMNARDSELTLDTDSQPEIRSQPDSATLAGEVHDDETIVFENERLRRKVRELLDRLNDVESRAASLHYRVAELTDVNKRLEMAYTGASTQANGLRHLVRDLTERLKRLGENNVETGQKRYRKSETHMKGDGQ